MAAGEDTFLHNLKRKVLFQVGRIRQLRPPKERLYQSSGPVLFCSGAFWNQGHARDFSNCSESYFVSCKSAAVPRISSPYNYVFGNRWTSPRQLSKWLNATGRNRRNAQSKTEFIIVNTIKYFGFTIRPDKLELRKYTTDTIRKIQNRAAQMKAACFRELCNVFQQFIRELSRVVYSWTRSFARIHGSRSCHLALMKSMKWIASRIYWQIYHPTDDSDAFDKWIGWVLLQTKLSGNII